MMQLSMLRTAILMMAASFVAMSQTAPIVNRTGHDFPALTNLAPGQLVTVFVTGIPRGRNYRAPTGTDLETTVSGISVGMSQFGPGGITGFQLPILEVRSLQTCLQISFGTACLPPMAAITVQVPFGIENPASCSACEPSFGVLLDGVGMYAIEGQAFPDQVHIVRAFDSVMPINATPAVAQCRKQARLDNMAPQNSTGLPCPPIVTRPDGSLVSWSNPARAGEELTALATGLGHTYPLAETGKVVRTAAGTIMSFAMDFNYRPNALGTRPPPVDTTGVPTPTYTASKEGEVGLYEVRFIVPAVPPGTPPCASLENVNGLPRDNVVYSNLTFSVGGQSSFDGAGICVAVEAN
ncbi:MAG: hypothetical protein IT541_17440 [Hyphomicrobiales bacterium]|nr:hypothetical protein [Hyphomicrobiales bacterium]